MSGISSEAAAPVFEAPRTSGAPPGRKQALSRRFLLNSASIFLGEAIARSATFLMALVIARRFGPVALGEYGYAVAVAGIVALVPDLGLHLYAVREMASRPERYRQLFWNIHWLKLLLSGVAGLAAVLFSGLGIPDEGRRFFFDLLLARAFFQTFSQAAMAVFKARESAQLAAIQQLANAAVVFAWVGTAAVLDAGLPAVVLGLVAGQAAEAFTGWYLLGVRFPPGPVAGWQGAVVRAMWREALPIGALSILQAASLRIDVLILGRTAPDDMLGRFQAAAWFTIASFLAASLLMAAVFPKLARVMKRPIRSAPYLKGLLKSGLFVPGAAALVLWAASPVVVPFLFGPGLASAAGTVRILAPAIPLLVLNTLLFYVYVAAGRRTACLAILVFEVAAGSALCLYASRFGPDGAAAACVLRELTAAVLYLTALSSDGRLRPLCASLVAALGAPAAVAAAAIGLGFRMPAGNWSALWTILALATLTGLLGFPRLREWRLLASDRS